MTETGREDNSSWVENTILEFIQRSPENNLQNETDEKAWEDALVGFSLREALGPREDERDAHASFKKGSFASGKRPVP